MMQVTLFLTEYKKLHTQLANRNSKQSRDQSDDYTDSMCYTIS